MSATAANLAEALRGLAALHAAAAPFLAHWPAGDAGAAAPSPEAVPGLPVLAFLPALERSGIPAADAVLDLARALARRLVWRQTYAEPQVDRRFLDRYGWTELVGRRGLLTSESLAAGLLMLGPDTAYPPHRHAAEEIYIPVSGRARWLKGASWSVRAPGTLIHHPPHVVHATRTRAEPLLALYLWRGEDLATPARLC
ncbi:transcriptional regulator [Aureimonas flava]|uniref:Transcriptional regulator n=1 Tax=Aureimonas flava TaxID=2320271 RepID=A0A3A1WK26_9HYPH|nr:dimethylsulfonioproprionate lyase family protein [Aureimonas flava]RIY00239.1 transcriptional regulator [Aureimonas flava]